MSTSDYTGKNLVCIFPGIGYTCDKPLLYYAGKIAKSYHYDVVRVDYTGFPKNIKGNENKIRKAVQIGVQQAEIMLQDINWQNYAEVIFISKSIGTVISVQSAQKITRSVRHILLTPLKETFQKMQAVRAISFHGTSDPWADTTDIVKCCKRKDIPLYTFDKADHSLETGNIAKDLEILDKVCHEMDNVLGGRSLSIKINKKGDEKNENS